MRLISSSASSRGVCRGRSVLDATGGAGAALDIGGAAIKAKFSGGGAGGPTTGGADAMIDGTTGTDVAGTRGEEGGAAGIESIMAIRLGISSKATASPKAGESALAGSGGAMAAATGDDIEAACKAVAGSGLGTTFAAPHLVQATVAPIFR